MFKSIRKSKLSKMIACYLAVQLVATIIAPTAAYALTSGPSQPEFNSFTPIGTSDMVNLSSGDFNYNIPIMDVGGYPLNLAYDSGITMDQEASWVGLGWNLNVGQINRQVRGLPDDFDGDLMRYENNRKENITVGLDTSIQFPVLGYEFIDVGSTLSIQNNNYTGISSNISLGPSLSLSKMVAVGFQFGGSSDGGASVSPTVSITAYEDAVKDETIDKITGSLGVTYDSQQGLSSFSIGASRQFKTLKINNKYYKAAGGEKGGGSMRGSFPMNNYMTFTPKSDLSFNTTNLTYGFGTGIELIVNEGPQIQLTGWGSYQTLQNSEKDKFLPAFGYENTENANSDNGILDFNREKDRIITENTNTLAPVNYTYDTYQILGQGFQGGFRAHRNRVGNVFNNKISSSGIGASIGGEISPGSYGHFGLDVEVNPSFNSTGIWDIQNQALSYLGNSLVNTNDLKAEKFHYKMGSDWSSDKEYEDSTFNYFGDKAMMVDISSENSTKYQRIARNRYKVKNYNSNGTINYEAKPLTNIERNAREKRRTSIRKVTNDEAKEDGLIAYRNEGFVKGYHTAGYVALKDDGSTYVYGETAYNTKKVEATFAINGASADCATGLVSYTAQEASKSNDSGRDGFFNKVTTPSYAHSFLLTSVLSSDYEDLTNNGPSIDDPGSYTKISYQEPTDYNWRVPMSSGVNVASYNAGLNTDESDQKGNYLYGEKELKYVDKIETKTHIAIFHLSDRMDGYGALGETGGLSSTSMQKIDKIELFNRKEYETSETGPIPIKTAHFEYDYEMAPGISNNKGEPAIDGSNEYDNQGGKLTLKKLYFTYRESNMGYYTPYSFNYVDDSLNPEYNLKGYDVWGSYKENEGSSSCDIFNSEMTPTEFPFTTQNKTGADNNVKSWSLESIGLPSGGILTVNFESDDYSSVQDKRPMQMFKVVGVGDTAQPSSSQLANTSLYNSNNFKKYLYIKLPQVLTNVIGEPYSTDDFYENFLKNNYSNEGDIGLSRNNLMYFRFLVNMTRNISSRDYDYVSGYLELERENINFFTNGGDNYVALPLVFQDKEGGLVGSNEQVNPISKSGWYFARKYLNKQSYGLNAGEPGNGFADAVRSLQTSFSQIGTIFGGPNQALKVRDIASEFIPNKSWVRLYEPSGSKLGGGVRVSKIELSDQWDTMTGNDANEIYSEKYGQEYSYKNENGTSSGVATFEPNGSKESPFVLPIFDDPVKIIAPMASNYIEKPLGESFFPAAQVTYARVSVKNLDKSDFTGLSPKNLTKHATGEVVTEFYTSKDFPTIVDHTDPQILFDKTGPLGSFLKLRTRNHIALSQGIVVHTNDMNGKMKSQRVRGEQQGEGEYISGVDYKYSVDLAGKLQNVVPVIDKNGVTSRDLVAVNYDMINDFRYSKSESLTLGADGNVGVLPLLFGIPTPVVTIFPKLRDHQDVLKMVTTTKVVQTAGILKEKIAYDLGSQVSTKNLAWDANTGQTLLTEVDNEYSDKYYNFTYPAYWYNKGMASASDNLGIEGELQTGYSDGDGDEESLFALLTSGNQQADDIFNVGDELLIQEKRSFPFTTTNDPERFWVSEIIGNTIRLMDRNGRMINQSCADDQLIIDNDVSFKIIRSGYRNQQMASMASVTSQENPIDINNDGTLNSLLPDSFEYNSSTGSKKVVNASAVLYKEYWQPQRQLRLPRFPTSLDAAFSQADLLNVSPVVEPQSYGFNPYLYNVRSEWRAVKSYAYLTGRDTGLDITSDVSTRTQGFFKQFTPFYKLGLNLEWTVEDNQWRFASQVSQYSPYGAELENKDALDRFSSAQYGYNYTLPIAVASNSKYSQMGYEGFEDHDYNFGNNISFRNPHFGFILTSTRSSNLTDEEAHSGRYSMKVSGGKEISLASNLQVEAYEASQPECEDDTSPPNGNQDVVIGSSPDCNQGAGSLTFELYGDPNAEFTFSYILNRGGAGSCVDFRTEINGISYTQTGQSITMNYNSQGFKEVQVSAFAIDGYFQNTNYAQYKYYKNNSLRGDIKLCNDVEPCTSGPGDPTGGTGSGGGGTGSGGGGTDVIIENNPGDPIPLQGGTNGTINNNNN